MGPLAFVNWATVNRLFCAVLWAVVFVLAVVVLAHVGNVPAPHHAQIGGR